MQQSNHVAKMEDGRISYNLSFWKASHFLVLLTILSSKGKLFLTLEYRRFYNFVQGSIFPEIRNVDP